MRTSPHHPPTLDWRAPFTAIILATYLYVFMEWVFFVTKPSSVSGLPWLERMEVLILTGGALSLFPLAAAICVLLAARIIKHPARQTRLLRIGFVIPALVFALTTLILFDNFTYTVWRFGIVSAIGPARLLYVAGFALIFLRMFRSPPGMRLFLNQRAFLFALGLMTVSLIGFTAIYFSDDPNIHNAYSGSSDGEYPNIIILGADGLSAKYLSAYGYSLNTTPFLTHLAKESVVAENAFPNAASTTASTAAMLTGKESVEMQVFRYPDILSGRHSFEHLPGMLKRHGYHTVEIGTPYYVDAGELNLLDGFDIAYNQSLNLTGLNVLLPILGNTQAMYFAHTIVERAAERLLHIFFIRTMDDPVKAVEDPGARIPDAARVELILDTLDRAEGPVFIFTHMMDTHGPQFASDEYVFSAGASSKEWDVNNYLDAILTFDGHVKQIYDHLEMTGKLDETILVLYTDHGFTYTINERIPILIRFPRAEHAGRIGSSVQVIDVPVTLLDYLTIPTPAWMGGASLLEGNPPADRMIIATTSGAPDKIAPPFYQINILQGIVCNRWYRLDVRKNTFNSGRIAAHSAACDKTVLPDKEQVHQRLITYLEEHGYDTSSLR